MMKGSEMMAMKMRRINRSNLKKISHAELERFLKSNHLTSVTRNIIRNLLDREGVGGIGHMAPQSALHKFNVSQTWKKGKGEKKHGR